MLYGILKRIIPAFKEGHILPLGIFSKLRYNSRFTRDLCGKKKKWLSEPAHKPILPASTEVCLSQMLVLVIVLGARIHTGSLLREAKLSCAEWLNGWLATSDSLWRWGQRGHLSIGDLMEVWMESSRHSAWSVSSRYRFSHWAGTWSCVQ